MIGRNSSQATFYAVAALTILGPVTRDQAVIDFSKRGNGVAIQQLAHDQETLVIKLRLPRRHDTYNKRVTALRRGLRILKVQIIGFNAGEFDDIAVRVMAEEARPAGDWLNIPGGKAG